MIDEHKEIFKLIYEGNINGISKLDDSDEPENHYLVRKSDLTPDQVRASLDYLVAADLITRGRDEIQIKPKGFEIGYRDSNEQKQRDIQKEISNGNKFIFIFTGFLVLTNSLSVITQVGINSGWNTSSLYAVAGLPLILFILATVVAYHLIF